MARNPRYLGFRAAGVSCRRAPLLGAKWHETPDVRGFVPGCPGFRSTPHLGAQLVLGVRLSVDPLSLSVEYSALANESRVAYWTQGQVTLNYCVGCDRGWGFPPPPVGCGAVVWADTVGCGSCDAIGDGVPPPPPVGCGTVVWAVGCGSWGLLAVSVSMLLRFCIYAVFPNLSCSECVLTPSDLN